MTKAEQMAQGASSPLMDVYGSQGVSVDIHHCQHVPAVR